MTANTNTITYSVPCPMHAGATHSLSCNGELVELTATLTGNTFSVAPCTSLTAQGWGSEPQLVDYMSRIDRVLPAATVTTVSHCDGLVSFSV